MGWRAGRGIGGEELAIEGFHARRKQHVDGSGKALSGNVRRRRQKHRCGDEAGLAMGKAGLRLAVVHLAGQAELRHGAVRQGKGSDF